MTTPSPSISATAPSSAISAAVAQYCAGWTKKGALEPFEDQPGIAQEVWFDADDKWVNDGEGGFDEPHFATDANSVLELLSSQKWHWYKWKSETHAGCSWVYLTVIATSDINAPVIHVNAKGSTFPLAACLCLLRAAGVSVTE